MIIRYSPNRQIALAAMFTAITLLALIMTHFVPGLELLVILFFPFLALYLFLTCSSRAYLAFAMALIISALIIDFNLALLDVLPALIMGAVFGLLVKARLSKYYIIVITSVVQALLILLINEIMIVLYHLDLLANIASLLLLTEPTYIYFLVLVVGFAQAMITFTIIENELRRINFVLPPPRMRLVNYLIPPLLYALSFIPWRWWPLTLIIAFLTLPPTLPSTYQKHPRIIATIQVVVFFLSLPLINLVASWHVVVVYPLALFVAPPAKVVCEYLVISKRK